MTVNSQPAGDSPKFPVDQICGDLCAQFTSRDIIVSAPPGAGKSTRIPLALLRHFPDKRFVMLQPRRVVVRHLATFLAKQLGESPGQTVGYRMRGESKVTAASRLVIMTEGVLTRWLQDDPELTGIDGIIFDEFHERSVHADLGLAFAIECQQQLRDDLRLIVMSATLDIQALSALMPDAVLLKSEGKMFPVTEHYSGDVHLDDVVKQVSRIVSDVMSKQVDGDMLVFLPSVKLIRLCISALQQANLDRHCDILPLYGALPLQQQSQALQPSATGRTKVILATNIAETSLTIEGVTVVIDSGREQQVTYDYPSAMTSLSTKMISQPSTIQRLGRAGRLSAGQCYRLWSASTQERLAQAVRPAIKEVDITPHLLDVLVWGTQFSALPLIDQPDQAQLENGFRVLSLLGLVDDKQQLTALGRKAHTLGFHPRVAAMLLQSQHASLDEQVSSAIAAVLIEYGQSLANLDGMAQLSAWLQTTNQQQYRGFCQALKVYGFTFTSQIRQLISTISLQTIGVYVALAYPERIGFWQHDETFKLAFGPRFQWRDRPRDCRWAVLLDGIAKQSGIVQGFVVLPCEVQQLQNRLPDLFTETHSLQLNREKGQLEARQLKRVGTSAYAKQPLPASASIDWAAAWKHAMETGTLGLPAMTLPLSEEGQQWLNRVRIAQHLGIDGFDKHPLTHEWLLEHSQQWLDHALDGCRTLKQVQQLAWDTLLASLLDWDQQQALDALLPRRLKIPTGESKRLVYRFEHSDHHSHMSATLAVKLQAMFGTQAPIKVCQNKLTVTIDLLSPAGRPLQTTQDIGGFWAGSYQQVAKEMRGRYPKHPWPENPATAPAMSGTKKAHGL